MDLRSRRSWIQVLNSKTGECWKCLKVKSFRDAVPDHLHDFEDVFNKESFDAPSPNVVSGTTQSSLSESQHQAFSEGLSNDPRRTGRAQCLPRGSSRDQSHPPVQVADRCP